jgi:AsmA protein
LRNTIVSYIALTMLTNAIGNLRKNLGQPLKPRSRRMLIIAFLAVSLFALFRIGAPFLISSNLVRENMERAVAQWTGHMVTIEGVPDLRFWPRPRITLKSITIRKRIEGGERVLGHVTRLSASFDLLGALMGKPEFRNFRLIDPQIFVVRDADGRLDWANDGLLSQAVRDASASGDEQLLDADADAPIGDVRIQNGSIEITSRSDGGTVHLGGIDGDLHWPYLSQAARLQAKAVIAGQTLSLDVATTQPLLLLSGRSANSIATIQSDLFTGHFKGIANLASHGFLSGDTEFSTPDFSALVHWAGIDLPAAEPLKSLSLQARVLTSNETLRLENLSLGINGVQATGILDLTRPQGKRPRLSGTLAIGSMDFSPVLAAVVPNIIDGSEQARQLRSQLELDVRLSTSHATLGPFQLDEVAIGMMNIGEQSRLDILDSDFEGGRLTGRIATIKEGTDGAVAVRLMVHNADFASIIQRLALRGPLPAARGSLELSVDVARPLNATAWRNAKGSVHFTAASGILPGVNMAAIRQLSMQRPYFPLSGAGSGSFEFQSADITAVLANGSAEIHQGRIVGTGDTMTLTGIVPYVNNSLALSASIQPTGAQANSPPSVLFIGGSWPDPVLWPISQELPKASE